MGKLVSLNCILGSSFYNSIEVIYIPCLCFICIFIFIKRISQELILFPHLALNVIRDL